MNLIEQLGGYEKANAEYKGVKHLRDSADIVVECRRVVFAIGILRQDLLEYRREHNIFEVGDSFVFNNGDNPEIMKVQHVWDDAVWGGYCGEIPKNTDIRHATDAEIKADRRLLVAKP